MTTLDRTRSRDPGVKPVRPLLPLLALLASACLPEGPGPLGAEGETVTEDETDGSTGGSGDYRSLIDQAAWVQLDADADPLAAHRPAEVACGLGGWYPEGASIEIDTNLCNYLALGQPSQVAITEGLGVRLGFYHFDLTAPEPAEAHLAVLVDGQVLYESTIAIPGDAYVYELEFAAPWTAPAGAEVVFHLHNHGQNTWVLQLLEAEQP